MEDTDFIPVGGGLSSHNRPLHPATRPTPNPPPNHEHDHDYTSLPPAADPDTCRICRGEPTPDEPLFYPCKCSGSIKYVHQDCLMEWLSHSQKKHCELCKTPFRFTKLYSPKMPSALPAHVFVTHMTRYLLGNVLVWLRAVLVGCVWLVWLPYLMRRMWSLLFWLSDEGLGSLPMGRAAGATARNATVADLGHVNHTSTLVDMASLALNQSSSQALAETIENSLNRTLSGTTSLPSRFFQMVLKTAFPSLVRTNEPAATGLDAATDFGPARGTLLSDVKFLRNLTRHPAVNRFVIMVLEGQIITVLVIVCFILVILVRDYVVQQQPEINLRAAFVAQDVPRPEERVPPRIPPVEEVHAAELEGDEPEGHNEGREAEDDVPPLVANEIERPIAPLRRRIHNQAPRGVGEQGRADGAVRLENADAQPRATGYQPPFGAGVADAMRNGEPVPSVIEQYRRLYRQSNGDLEVFQHMLREQNLLDPTSLRRITGELGLPAPPSLASANVVDDDGHVALEITGSREESEGTPSHPPDIEHEEEQGESSSSSKGKEPVRDPWPPGPSHTGEEQESSNDEDTDTVSYSRRRAISDGAQPREYMNPLANNNWSFDPIETDASPSPGLGGPWSFHPDPTEGSSSTAQAELPARPQFVFTGAPDNSSSGDSEQGSSRDHERTPEAHDTTDTTPAASETREDEPPQEVGALIPAQEPPRVEQQPARQPQPVLDRVADFFWGDIAPPANNQERDNAGPANPEDDGNDDGFVRMDPEADDLADDDGVEDGEAALDQDALDDIEDFEGIMELIGMRGPLGGLFQNAIFCACLVFVTIFLCVFLPYNLGRTTLCVLANPMSVARALFSLAKFIQDLAAVVAGGLAWATLSLVGLWERVFLFWRPPTESIAAGVEYTLRLTSEASKRFMSEFLYEVPIIPASAEIQNFSAVSHAALLTIKGHVGSLFTAAWEAGAFLLDSSVLDLALSFAKNTVYVADFTLATLLTAATSMLNPGSWIINLERPGPSPPVDPLLASWSGGDRFWAILAGYVAFALLAALYVRRGSPFSTGPLGQELEASVVDVINQASGVTKVILIIGIEMLVFPLYCGLLMDAALLPLFEHATVWSRYEFGAKYPLTSIFVHWFVGTGYMFHFALFVSMCRKIMRKGVLYFIRDPDDPEFHPVRDVLERRFFTQLRKILFSALVYGGLVIVCLGGVVWSLSLLSSAVLPIHYSSNEPVLEFPVDLLFYNFLMPLAVRVLRPSNALHAMYTWWFKRCARALRLTWFLFGERQVDEEGRLVLPPDSPHRKLPWYQRLVLKIGTDKNVAPKSLREILTEMAPPPPKEDTPTPPPPAGAAAPKSKKTPKPESFNKLKRKLVREGQLRRSGRFVRTPASDQVRIPKGRRVFLDVHEATQQPLAPLARMADMELYFSEQYQLVYLPPNFRARVFGFIFLIWMFAAVTGVALTIVPLVVGRWLFGCVLPEHVRTNDIYAFSIGIYVLGALGYGVVRAGRMARKVRQWAGLAHDAVVANGSPARMGGFLLDAAKVVYAYFSIFIFFPLLAATLVELYLLIPIHTYLQPPHAALQPSSSPPTGADTNPVDATLSESTHTIHAVQTWTLGLLYIKLALRATTLALEGTPLAHARAAIFHAGWLRPDVRVLTRAFVLPALLLTLIAVVCPPLVLVPLLRRALSAGGILVGDAGKDEIAEALLYRLSFSTGFLLVLGSAGLVGAVRVFRGWQVRVRDEAYLVGERLHNFAGGRA